MPSRSGVSRGPHGATVSLTGQHAALPAARHEGPVRLAQQRARALPRPSHPPARPFLCWVQAIRVYATLLLEVTLLLHFQKSPSRKPLPYAISLLQGRHQASTAPKKSHVPMVTLLPLAKCSAPPSLPPLPRLTICSSPRRHSRAYRRTAAPCPRGTDEQR